MTIKGRLLKQEWSEKEYENAYKPDVDVWVTHMAGVSESRSDRDVPRCQADLPRSQQDINAKLSANEARVTCEACIELIDAYPCPYVQE